MAFQVISRDYLDIISLAFFRIPFAPSVSLPLNNLALYSKDLKLLLLAMSTLKLATSSLE